MRQRQIVPENWEDSGCRRQYTSHLRQTRCFFTAPQTKGMLASDTNLHCGSEEGLSHHRKMKLESFKSHKLLLSPKADRVRGGLPSTWICADTELSMSSFSRACWATSLLPRAAPLSEHLPQFICLHSRCWLNVWGISFDWFSMSRWNRAQIAPGILYTYREAKKATTKQAQVSYTVREEIF